MDKAEILRCTCGVHKYRSPLHFSYHKTKDSQGSTISETKLPYW